jgi:hypothetical protein
MLIRQSKDYIEPNEGMEFNVPCKVFNQVRRVGDQSKELRVKARGGDWGQKKRLQVKVLLMVKVRSG